MSELDFSDFFTQLTNENSYEARQKELFSVLVRNTRKLGLQPPELVERVLASNPSLQGTEGVWKYAWDTTTNSDEMIRVLELCGVSVDFRFAMVCTQPMSRTYKEASDAVRTQYPEPPTYATFLEVVKETWTPSAS